MRQPSTSEVSGPRLRRTDDMGMEDAHEAPAGSPDVTLQSSQLGEIELKMSGAMTPISEKVEDDASGSIGGNHPAHFAVIALLRPKSSFVQPTPLAERQDKGGAHRFKSR